MRPLTACLFVVAAAPVVAQSDRIVWNDGTETKGCTVVAFTGQELQFRADGRAQSRSADAVADLDIAAVRVAFARGFGAANAAAAAVEFRREAEQLIASNPFVAQFGFAEAARALIRHGRPDEALALLAKIEQDLPQAGVRPEMFRLQLDDCLGRGKDGAATAKRVAASYRQAAVAQGWPAGFVHEAAYLDLMARAASAELGDAALQRELQALLRQTEGAYPSVADRVSVEIAAALRRANRLADARQIYEAIVDKETADETTRGQALLGVGHTYFAEGDPSHTEPYRTALLMFLRVYVETPGAAADTRAQALYYAAESSDKCGAADAAMLSRRLRGALRRDFAASAWARR